MGVDYRNQIVLGIKTKDIKKDIEKNGIDFKQFCSELSEYEFLYTYSYYDDYNYENTIVGNWVDSNEFGWEEFSPPNIELSIDFSKLKESKYYYFLLETFKKHKPKLYLSLVVS